MHAGCFAHQGAPYTQGTVHVARQPCLTPHRGVSQEASRAQEPSAEEVQALRAEVELLHQTLQDVTQVPPTLPCTPTAATLSVPQFPLPWWTTAERCPRPSQAVLADDPGSPTEPPRLPCRSLSPAAAAATLGAVHGALRRRHFQLQVSEEEEEEEEDDNVWDPPWQPWGGSTAAGGIFLSALTHAARFGRAEAPSWGPTEEIKLWEEKRA